MLSPLDIGSLVQLTTAQSAAAGSLKESGIRQTGIVVEVKYCYPDCDVDSIFVMWPDGKVEGMPVWMLEKYSGS